MEGGNRERESILFPMWGGGGGGKKSTSITPFLPTSMEGQNPNLNYLRGGGGKEDSRSGGRVIPTYNLKEKE